MATVDELNIIMMLNQGCVSFLIMVSGNIIELI